MGALHYYLLLILALTFWNGSTGPLALAWESAAHGSAAGNMWRFSLLICCRGTPAVCLCTLSCRLCRGCGACASYYIL